MDVHFTRIQLGAISANRLEVLGGDIAKGSKIRVNPSDGRPRRRQSAGPSAFSKKQ